MYEALVPEIDSIMMTIPQIRRADSNSFAEFSMSGYYNMIYEHPVSLLSKRRFNVIVHSNGIRLQITSTSDGLIEKSEEFQSLSDFKEAISSVIGFELA